jgi:hypothetical protein
MVETTETAGLSGSAVSPNHHASPPYPLAHSGTVLVCGFGPGFFEDLERARALRPDAQVIAINEACKAVRAFAIFTLHPEKLRRFREQQDLHFGKGHYTCHTGGKHCAKMAGNPLLDYGWPAASGGGTSVWTAQKMARLMGFEERILVGAPLIHGNYADRSPAKGFREGWQRRDGKGEVLANYRAFVERDTDWHEGCYSMSGFTREVLGAPEGA